MDKFRYKKIKLAKCENGGSKTTSCSCGTRGDSSERWRERRHMKEKMPEMEKFVAFWGGIWEREETMPNMPWMEEIRRQLNEKVNQVNEFNITFEKVKKEVVKRKGWTAPGIDGIHNYRWKKLEPAKKALSRAFTKIKEDNTNIPTW